MPSLPDEGSIQNLNHDTIGGDGFDEEGDTDPGAYTSEYSQISRNLD
tara:strand:+ start:1580 stop:1720 length:141 start_codon:yes stop_codon:yes gene_type:complete